MDELARCDHEQREIESREHRAGWLAAMGWADWEIERELIVRGRGGQFAGCPPKL